MATIYRIFKTEFVSPRPLWIVKALLDISPRNFIKADRSQAEKVLDNIENSFLHGVNSNIRRYCSVRREKDAVSILNNKDKVVVSFRIKACDDSMVINA